MNTLFKSKVSRKSVLAMAQEKIPKTVEIKSISHGMDAARVHMIPVQITQSWLLHLLDYHD